MRQTLPTGIGDEGAPARPPRRRPNRHPRATRPGPITGYAVTALLAAASLLTACTSPPPTADRSASVTAGSAPSSRVRSSSGTAAAPATVSTPAADRSLSGHGSAAVVGSSRVAAPSRRSPTAPVTTTAGGTPPSSSRTSTGTVTTPTGPATSTAPVTPGRATPQTPPDSPLPVWDDDPVALAAAISRAVFRTAPVAVLASSSDDDATARSAARRARQWHAPLLLWDRPAHSATAPSRPDTQPWAELARLHSGWILAMDPAARRAAQRHCAATVVSDPADLPDRRAAPRPAVRLTILLERPAPPGMRRAIAAARATVLAAGARIVELHGHDPRTDPAAIAALARWPRSPVIGIGPHLGKPATFAARVATAATGVQLPGGGQVMFPHRRLVALYGNPYDSQLGALGQQDLAGAIRRAAKVASGFHDLSSVPVVPTFEIIATVASAAAGPDGDYSAESSVADLRPWVDAAGKAGMYVILDLQAGRASLLDQAKHYTDLLTLPYVGLAIDPEWKLGPDQYPLQQVGSVDAAQVNRVIDWLSALTARHHRPQKVLVLHQFRVAMLQNEAAIHTHDDNVAVLIHMDGQGSPGAKDATWRQVVAAAPGGVSFGWKNFYVMDTRTLTPAETMARDPRPLMISYQ